MREAALFALAGPTASGKTKLSMALAKKLNAEIISVDSTLVYQGLDVGSAKPMAEEMATIPHHLIDILPPWQPYSVNRFLSDVAQVIKAIQTRRKPVLLVGGTMLYFKAFIEGISILPEADPKLRQKIASEPLHLAYQRLRKIDPETAERLAPNDKQRICRALEVSEIAAMPFSKLIKTKKKTGGVGDRLKLAALFPSNRKHLHDAIAKRFYQMLESGFLKEVQRLYDHPEMRGDLPSMRSVGYRQAWQYLEGHDTKAQFIEKGIAATRQLAKRQLTWIRNWPHQVQLVDTALDEAEKLRQILGYFQTP